MPIVQLPSQLAGFAGGRRRIDVEATSVADAFAALDAEAPMLRSQVFEADGAPRRFIGLFVDERQVFDAAELAAPIGAASRILVVQSVAGG